MARRWLPVVLLFPFVALLVPPHTAVLAQLQTIEITGRVLGPDEAPVKAARVLVLDGLGAILAVAESDDDGRFSFRHFATGDYWLRAETGSMRSSLQLLSGRGRLPRVVTLRLVARAQEEVEVPASDTGPEVRIALAGDTVRRSAGRLETRGLQAAIATTPGWSAEDNGLLHFRGVDDGFLYVVDGVPVYERLDPLFGLPPDAATIGSVQILSGYIPPEYGLRSGGVIEIRSATGPERGWGGALDANVGSFGTEAASALIQRPLGEQANLVFNVAGEHSKRFLDPVHPKNLHNTGTTGSAQGEFSRAAGSDVLTIRTGVAGSSFEVPQDEEQEDAGQDQRQRLRQANGTISWQRAWSDRTVSHSAVVGRWTSARLVPSPADTPATVEARRAQVRLGALVAVTHLRGRHTLKAGLETAYLRLDERFLFAVTDAMRAPAVGLSAAAIRFTREEPFDFRDQVRRPQYSVYAQDSWRPSPRLTLAFGLRFDHTRLLLDERQLSPRLGVSYSVGGSMAVRASINRFYQPPQPEYLLLASSAQARALSPFAERGGGADVPGERQVAFEVGLDRKLGPARLDLAVWQRRIRNQADPNVLFGTNIIFPNSVARGRATGIDVRVELPRRQHWSGYLSYTLSRVVQYGPINGGLFLEEGFPDIGPGTRFTPDHDQRHVAAAAVSYEHERSGWAASIAGRYQSGTPIDLPEDALADFGSRVGSDLVNLDEGRVKPHLVIDAVASARIARWRKFDLTARAGVFNLTDRSYAFNFGNPFSGTHFGAPRSVTCGLRLASR